MPKVSVVIPSRNERFLQQTVSDILSKAEGDIEVIVNLDGYWPDPPLFNDHRLVTLHRGDPRGMRPGINSAVAISTGDYILKADAHTMWDQGFDVKLLADMQDNWVVVPRRKRLDAENWTLQDTHKPDIDYMLLSYPDDPNDFGGPGLNGKLWEEKNRDESLKTVMIDDLMSAQGSAWFMKKSYFYELDLMDWEKWGTFWAEFQEIGFKCWLSGGRVVVNKKTWYAHLHKGKKYGRMYPLAHALLDQGAHYAKRWMNEKVWDKQTLPFSSMIERFMPIPGWPEDWKAKLNIT